MNQFIDYIIHLQDPNSEDLVTIQLGLGTGDSAPLASGPGNFLTSAEAGSIAGEDSDELENGDVESDPLEDFVRWQRRLMKRYHSLLTLFCFSVCVFFS